MSSFKTGPITYTAQVPAFLANTAVNYVKIFTNTESFPVVMTNLRVAGSYADARGPSVWPDVTSSVCTHKGARLFLD